MEKLLVTSNFSFSHNVFKRLVPQTRKNKGLFGKDLTTPRKNPLENIMRNGENSVNQHFSSFPAMFSTHSIPHFCFLDIFIISSATAFNLGMSKNLSYGKELISCSTLVTPLVPVYSRFIVDKCSVCFTKMY